MSAHFGQGHVSASGIHELPVVGQQYMPLIHMPLHFSVVSAETVHSLAQRGNSNTNALSSSALSQNKRGVLSGNSDVGLNGYILLGGSIWLRQLGEVPPCVPVILVMASRSSWLIGEFPLQVCDVVERHRRKLIE